MCFGCVRVCVAAGHCGVHVIGQVQRAVTDPSMKRGNTSDGTRSPKSQDSPKGGDVSPKVAEAKQEEVRCAGPKGRGVWEGSRGQAKAGARWLGSGDSEVKPAPVSAAKEPEDEDQMKV